MFEVDEAARIITEAADPEANVIFGAVIDENYTGQVKCTVIATGFDSESGTIRPSLTQSTFSSPSIGTNTSSFKPAERAGESSQREPVSNEAVSTATDLNMEELEVPAFMRKKVGK